MSAIETTEFATPEPGRSGVELERRRTGQLKDRFVSAAIPGLAAGAAVGAMVELANAFGSQIVVGLFMPAALLCLLAGFLVQVVRRETPRTARVALHSVPSPRRDDETGFRRTPPLDGSARIGVTSRSSRRAH